MSFKVVFMFSKIDTKKGFTLIELLIVIAIIGILSVALLPAITSGPARARDAARIAAVNDVVAAMEQYNLERGGYPRVRGTTAAFCLDFTRDDLDLCPRGNHATGCSGADTAGDIRQHFGKIPNAARVSDVLCNQNNEFIFYRQLYPPDNYMIAVQVERRDSANVDSAINVHSGLRDYPSGPTSKEDIISLTDSDPPADGPWFYLIGR